MSADAITHIPAHLRTVRGAVEPIVFVQNGHVFANSEDVATFFGKQHSGVMRAIRTLIYNDKSCACNFEFTSRPVDQPMGGTREVATCNMNRDGFTLLVMGFTGKRALAWKLRYIEAFNIMELALAGEGSHAAKSRAAKSVDVRPQPIDMMDAGMDMLATAETALYAEEMLDKDTLRAIRGTVGQALKMLAPVRASINA